MIINIKREKIYFDANFLIYWFISKKPELKKRARFLLAYFLANKNYLFSSPLAFDEAWWGIKNEYNQQNKVNLSCSDEPVFSELKNFTDIILPKLELAQFVNANSGVMTAMGFVKNFKLDPRDAFHLAIIKDNDINFLVTDDGDFTKKQSAMGIVVQPIM